MRLSLRILSLTAAGYSVSFRWCDASNAVACTVTIPDGTSGGTFEDRRMFDPGILTQERVEHVIESELDRMHERIQKAQEDHSCES